jgi:hypothetical protein
MEVVTPREGAVAIEVDANLVAGAALSRLVTRVQSGVSPRSTSYPSRLPSRMPVLGAISGSFAAPLGFD